MKRIGAILLAASLAWILPACDFYPEAAGPVDGVAECSETVLSPPGANPEQTFPAVEPHEDAYGAAPAPEQVRIQWIAQDPSRSVGFLWRTGVETKASVAELRVGDGEPVRYEGASFTFGGAQSDQERMHEVRLCGRLEPGTTYTYRVGGDSAWSADFAFTTPREPGSFDTFRVAIAGDSRGASDTWAAVVAAMQEEAPDLFLFSGDMVQYGTAQGEWDAWFGAGAEVWPSKFLVPAIGNHELLARNYFAQFALPGNEEWFSFDFGTLHVVSLNDIVVRNPNDIPVAQADFLDRDLTAAAAQPWKLVLHHWSAYSSCTTHNSNEELRTAWSPIEDEHGVQLDVAGHNHIYERSVPIRDGQEVAPGEGTLYLTSGGAGAPLYMNSEDLWFNEVAAPVEHFMIVDFGPDSAIAVVRDLDRNVIDEFIVPR
jgi:hypothetical protein